MIHELMMSLSGPLCVRGESFAAWARSAAQVDQANVLVNAKGIDGGPSYVSRVGNVAVMDISGMITQRLDISSKFGRYTFPAEMAAHQIIGLAADSAVSAIVLDINSGGGTVAGTSALSDAIYRARGVKPVIAVANEHAYSAAYWIASAADRIVITPEGGMGSIGVYTQHIDDSEFWKSLGVKIETIYAGEFKGAQVRPLTETTRAHIQEEVDALEQQFVQAVARNRDTSVKDVRDRMADARIFVGQAAVTAGLADSVGRLSDVLSTLQSKQRKNTYATRESGIGSGGGRGSVRTITGDRACAGYAAGFVR